MPHEQLLPPLRMKTGTGHSSSFFSEKFSHLNIDKVCHRQALFVFLPLLLFHISSHALALSPVSVPPFSSPSPIFDPRRQLCSKSRGLSRENRRVFGKSPQVLKRSKRRKSTTGRFRSVILPLPTIPLMFPTQHATHSYFPFSDFHLHHPFVLLAPGVRRFYRKSTFMHNFLPNYAQEVGSAIRYHTPHYSHFKRTKE